MASHPNRSRGRLARYGAKLRTVDGQTVVEMVDPNDGARARYQYRARGHCIERRVLCADGAPMIGGSPWELLTAADVAALHAVRGQYHPILDPLGLRAGNS